MLQNIAYNWFLIFYFASGLLLFIQGLVWMRRPESFLRLLESGVRNNERPKILLKSIRYLFLFTLISVFFSFFPFSIFELGFSLLLMILIYIGSSILLKWNQLKIIIRKDPELIIHSTRKAGQSLFVLSITCFVLTYRFLITHGSV